jgi:hypothetical protein
MSKTDTLLVARNKGDVWKLITSIEIPRERDSDLMEIISEHTLLEGGDRIFYLDEWKYFRSSGKFKRLKAKVPRALKELKKFS